MSEDYTVEQWLDDMAEHSGVGHYDENGEWVWDDERPTSER